MGFSLTSDTSAFLGSDPNTCYRRFPAVVSGLRFYSPALAKWLSRDPIGERGGWNLYGFVKNKTPWQIDPLGFASQAISEAPEWHRKKFKCDDVAKAFNDPSRSGLWPPDASYTKKLGKIKEKRCPVPKFECDCKCKDGQEGRTSIDGAIIYLCDRKVKEVYTDWDQIREHEMSHALDICLGAKMDCSTQAGVWTFLCSEIRAYALQGLADDQIIKNALGSVDSACGIDDARKSASDMMKNWAEVWAEFANEFRSETLEKCKNLGMDDQLPFPPDALKKKDMPPKPSIRFGWKQ